MQLQTEMHYSPLIQTTITVCGHQHNYWAL